MYKTSKKNSRTPRTFSETFTQPDIGGPKRRPIRTCHLRITFAILIRLIGGLLYMRINMNIKERGGREDVEMKLDGKDGVDEWSRI